MGGSGDWTRALQTWLEPFLARLGHPARRRMCPLYVAGLMGPGERKSLQPIAARLAPADYDQLHHFIAVGPWDDEPLEAELLAQADRLVGGPDAILVIDDTALPKKGQLSVGVAPQYASALGKNANCQTLVSLTLAQGEGRAPRDLCGPSLPRYACGSRMGLRCGFRAGPASTFLATRSGLWASAARQGRRSIPCRTCRPTQR